MAEVKKVLVPIYLSADEYLEYYKGAAKNVFARDLEGRTVQFPANLLQKFVTQEGVDGVFEIAFGPGGKLISIRKLNDLNK
jgi:hypothetical protein